MKVRTTRTDVTREELNLAANLRDALAQLTGGSNNIEGRWATMLGSDLSFGQLSAGPSKTRKSKDASKSKEDYYGAAKSEVHLSQDQSRCFASGRLPSWKNASYELFGCAVIQKR